MEAGRIDRLRVSSAVEWLLASVSWVEDQNQAPGGSDKMQLYPVRGPGVLPGVGDGGIYTAHICFMLGYELS